MNSDDDIAASLPQPPPPRPARRDAAIAEAMRRFDAAGEAPRPAGRQSSATPAPWQMRINRPKIGALVTIVLVAAIGLPILMSGDPRLPVTNRAPANGVQSPANPGPVTGPSVEPVPPIAATVPPPLLPPQREAAIPPPPVVAPAVPADAPCGTDNCSARVASESNADAKAITALPRPPEAQAAQGYSASPQIQAKQEFRRPPAAPENAARVATAAPPAPPPPPARIAEADTSGSDIVVTGAKVSASARRVARSRAKRGDWNACTVSDPGRDLAACRKLVDAGKPGPAGRAAAYLADGLSRAWQDDVDGAIAAFDRAIEVSPKLSFAYLNRGLARARNGDAARAIADLDQAVRYAPNAARNYYQRSLMRRQEGDEKRAAADEERAIDLDSRYEAVIVP
ncbi:tetratricopeptide repeat protein [Sphingomonas alpina]|uniref:Tetratricopeptide repeat protein n=1 Tax=Sphingomonas alpina TaxID=653931 RepID=A0A7H0LJG5_9SPHN|nr:tetratricopeptide repeat protein [Sphingomonas alpina]QNQ09818.1 tetratricopeptide repeat protein [Sphingomonas alpina]